MLIVGLTGSIAMGKSTAAAMFAARGVPIFDSDRVVHDLYAPSGDAVEPISLIAPDAINNGAVDRDALTLHIRQNPDQLQKIEAIVHPLVRKAQEKFIASTHAAGAPFIVLDIPLLFETSREAEVDKIIVVSAPESIQRSRALARSNMTPEKLDFLMSKQVPDAVKRRSADFIIDTSGQLSGTARQVDDIISRLLGISREGQT